MNKELNEVIDSELLADDEEAENEGLNELDFDGQHYIDDTTDDQDRDLQDYYNLVESGVDLAEDDPFDGFQFYNENEIPGRDY